MKKLHPTQKQLLKLLTKLSGEGYTIRELQDSLNLSTPSLVFFHLQQLEKKGYIERNPMNPADYRVRQPPEESGLFLVNLYGLARCGPSGTILSGDVEERLELPPQFLGVNLQNPFFVRAHGDSMEPRYFAGELLYVNPNRPVTKNCFVAVELNDGQGLIKQFVRRSEYMPQSPVPCRGGRRKVVRDGVIGTQERLSRCRRWVQEDRFELTAIQEGEIHGVGLFDGRGNTGPRGTVIPRGLNAAWAACVVRLRGCGHPCRSRCR